MLRMGINGKVYEQQTGVVLGNNFLNRDKFGEWVENLFSDRTLVSSYGWFFDELEKVVKGNIVTFSNLEALQQAFLLFTAEGGLGALGGQIGIISTFNFDVDNAVNSDVYFAIKEEDLVKGKLQNGKKVYENSKLQLDNLIKYGQQVNELNEIYKKHLSEFYIQLNLDGEYISPKDRARLYRWAYHNMKTRFKVNRGNTPMSLAKYFYGNGHRVGYINEAYGTHVALAHPDLLMLRQNQKMPVKSVVEEHGGYGSVGLFNLLKSSKGNTKAQLSGDIVTITMENGQAKVNFNIQSKASLKDEYSFGLRYTEFLRHANILISYYKDWNSITDKKEKIDELFKKFSTQAWIPIEKRLTKNVTEVANSLGKSIIPKKKS